MSGKGRSGTKAEDVTAAVGSMSAVSCTAAAMTLAAVWCICEACYIIAGAANRLGARQVPWGQPGRMVGSVWVSGGPAVGRT